MKKPITITSTNEPVIERSCEFCHPDGSEYFLPEGAKIAWAEYDGDNTTTPFRVIFAASESNTIRNFCMKENTISFNGHTYYIKEVGVINPAEREYYFANLEKFPPHDRRIRVILS